MAKKKKPDDPLAIPEFLKSNRPKLTDLQVKRLNNEEREWIMPKGKKDSDEQPEINTVSPSLPVEVNYKPLGKAGTTYTFDCLGEGGFEDWFDPDMHKIEGSIADASVTMISVVEKDRPTIKATARGKKSMAKEPVPEVPTRKTARSLTHGIGGLEAASIKAGRKADKAIVGAIPPPLKKVGRGAVVKKGKGTGRGGHNVGQQITRHGCTVNGGKEVYKSTWQAWLAFKLNPGKCVKFRGLLKQAKGGSATYEEDGKKYVFKLAELPKK